MDKLQFINEQMEAIGIPYNLIEWTSDEIPNRYWVGEVTETPTSAENGYEESTVLLTGTTRGSWLDLHKDREKIKRHFPASCGLRASTESGSIAVFYSGSFPVPTGEADLKRIQVNLDIKEWKGTI